MPIVNMRDMLIHARRHGYAVAALDVVSLDFLEGVIRAAEDCRAPAIVSLAESHFEHYDFELLMAATVAACKRSSAPLAIHLDHGASLDSAITAIRHGCNGVMVDGSHLPLSDNLALTKAVTDMAHACGVAVEGELGCAPEVEGEDAEKHPSEIVYTTPGEARGFVERTGVDCLAVSVGTVHGRMRGRARLDFSRLRAIAEAVEVPLVIHGGTGLTDEQFRKLIGLGVAKINCYTALADAAAVSIREVARGAQTDYTAVARGVRDAVRAEAERVIRLFGGSGRAAEVLAQCRPWRAIEHVILYNVEGVTDREAEAMMARGRQVLSRIPGVRRVITGRAVTESPRYRFCWIIEFAHQNVIAAYRDHPDHVAFANGLFRPIAGDRVSIDFAHVSTQP